MPFSIDPQPGENETECARCGAIIYDQLSRCPNCGVNLFEPEEDSGSEWRESEASSSSGFGQKVSGFFRKLLNKPYSAEEVFGTSLDQAYIYNDLLQKVGGDHEVVERLVGFEQNLAPKSTRLQWLKNALQRWERDNHSPQKPE